MILDAFFNKSTLINSDADRMGLQVLINKAITDKTTVFKHNISGFCKNKKFDVNAFASKMGLRPLIVEEDYGHLFVASDTVMEVEVSSDNYYIFYFITTNKINLRTFIEIQNLFESNQDNTGKVFCIIKRGSNLDLSSIGLAGINFNPKNYSKKVVSDYKYVIKDLKSENPSGRISIFEGVPGSGKTHLVKSLLNDVKDTTFILVPPELLSSLAGPEFIPLLISYTRESKGPIVLILEDADECLVKRDSSNINSIQALLNLSDGIVGSMLDLRIVATTNATKIDFEPAILRNGRLSKRIEVNLLSAKEANNLLFHLFSDKFNLKSKKQYNQRVKNFVFEKPIVLADIYAKARKLGWAP